MNGVKLWKTTVNQFGWNEPKTYFFDDKRVAEEFGNRFPAGGTVKYAGLFSAENAAEIIHKPSVCRICGKKFYSAISEDDWAVCSTECNERMGRLSGLF